MDSKCFFCKFIDHIIVLIIRMSFDFSKFNVNPFFRLTIKITICNRSGFVCFPVTIAPARDTLIIVINYNRRDFVVQSLLHRCFTSFDLTSHISHLRQLWIRHFLRKFLFFSIDQNHHPVGKFFRACMIASINVDFHRTC